MRHTASSAKAIRVYVVEDMIDIREFVCEAIHADSRLELAGVAQLLSEASAWLLNEKNHTDVLLVDLGLPDGTGLELIAQCRDFRPEIQSMVLSIFGNEENVFNALRAGAIGYLLKSSAADNIVAHILDLVAGGSPLSPAVARLVLAQSRKLTEPMRTLPVPAIDPLSPREISVLRCITMGHSYAEIATQLFVSTHTVNAHIRNIYRKLQVSSRSEASHVAQRAGLLPPDRA
jgi:DNA-binding NarL/FixJ family response regulator